MDQARSTISKIFNGEPRSYTRFNLTQNMEGDNSQVEMKLSDTDEEAGGNGGGELHAHSNGRSAYVAHKPGRTPKSLCFAVIAILLIFIIGYLIGYLVHRKNDLAPACAAATLPSDAQANVVRETSAAPLMNWADVKSLLAERLSPAQFDTVFRDLSSNSHRAGSLGDEHLGNKVAQKFKDYGMNGWTNEHFVRVQDAPASGSNLVVFKGKQWRPRCFLSYSASGVVTAPVRYAHYGDFKTMSDPYVDLSGKVVLVRAGRISFAEKVANAARRNASAVLIFPDFSLSEEDNVELFGHVHLGSGDPYTPGFPSFNHTQFPPVQSSGLPSILAQTITASMAKQILTTLGGASAPRDWGTSYKLGDDTDNITVQVDNVQAERKIVNVFGVIKGFVDQDRYVVLGAQRDAWGPGFARSTVGTSVLVELARSISWMVEHGGFRPRRSIVFASWSGGEYGSVGATEWLEGYLSSLSMKAFSYINLDGIVAGMEGFKVSASPLLYSLIKSTLQEVKRANQNSLYEQYGKESIMEAMRMDDAAYPFLAFSGIPSISFRFTTFSDYKYFGTDLDTRTKLEAATSTQVSPLATTAAQFAGQVALRLVHDHLLRFDLKKYDILIRTQLNEINKNVKAIQSAQAQSQVLPRSLTVQWLMEAAGAYGRASRALNNDIQNSDLGDVEMCRSINDRLMMAERNLLSPYVSPKDTPFRHVLLGSGQHTLTALQDHLKAIKANSPEADADLFRNQFALLTWTIQGCANSLAGDIWALHNEI